MADNHHPGTHESLRQDLLLSLRTLRKEPLSAFITSLTLALGIGLCTIAFSLVYGVFIRGLDVPQANRLTLIYRTNPSKHEREMPVTVHDFYDWRAQQKSFEGLANFSSGTMNLSGSEGPERYRGAFVSANAFELLRVRPILGTGFQPSDDVAGAPLTVVLGYEVWSTRFRADSEIAGKTVMVNGEAATIRGVMPQGFLFPQDQKLWMARRDSRGSSPDRNRGAAFQVFGRLKDGVSLDQAKLEMSLIAGRLAKAYPASNEGVTTAFQSFVQNDAGPEVVAIFSAMQVAALFVLLIAIANVSNLLLARATLRTKEAAVRTALGASRLRVVLPFFAETLVLALAGAMLGIGIAYAGITMFDGATQGIGKPYYMIFKLDLPVLLFVVGVTVITAMVAGLAPSFHVLKTDVQATLKDESRGSSGVLGGRLTRVLVTAEIALSCALLIGAGLMVKSIVKLGNYDYPYATKNIFTARLGIFDTEYPDTASRRRFFDELKQRIRALPSVGAVTFTTNLPTDNSDSRIGIAGQVYATDHDYPGAQNAIVSERFFETFGVKLLRGRDFGASDTVGAVPVAIVNQSFATHYYPGREALGQQFAEWDGAKLGPWKTIVGVVPDLKMEGFDTDHPPPWGYYTPLSQRDLRFVTMAAQVSAGDPMSLTSGVREAVRSLNPNLPIYDVYSMKQVIHQKSWFITVFGTLFIVFGAAALFMATVGLYGVLAFSVSRRMKEMGIRMALGANARDVNRLVLRQGGKQIVFGLAIGLVLAYGLTRVIGILMFEVTPQDPPVFTLVVVVIALVGLLASLIPARRATRAQPVTVLRYE